MDPLRFSIAAAPLGVYFLLIALIHLRRKPFVTTGARDIAALSIGMLGLVSIGPMELFFPEAAARSLGAITWVLLYVFYGLCVSLLALLLRPRIVIYNARAERIRSVLSEFAGKVDHRARWIDETLVLPTLNVKLNVEGSVFGYTTQLVAVGHRQALEGWRTIHEQLQLALAEDRSPSQVIGFSLLMASVTLMLSSAIWMVTRQHEVAQAFLEIFRL